VGWRGGGGFDFFRRKPIEAARRRRH
jgi:hypothetical protein